MKQFYLAGEDVEKWIYQNKGEYIEVVEGCLLDNYLIQTKRGYAAIFEHYLNCWTSDQIIYFSRDNEAENFFYDHFKGVDIA